MKSPCAKPTHGIVPTLMIPKQWDWKTRGQEMIRSMNGRNFLDRINLFSRENFVIRCRLEFVATNFIYSK